jgi:hypothetical protein
MENRHCEKACRVLTRVPKIEKMGRVGFATLGYTIGPRKGPMGSAPTGEAPAGAPLRRAIASDESEAKAIGIMPTLETMSGAPILGERGFGGIRSLFQPEDPREIFSIKHS